MNVVVENAGPCRKKLRVEVPAERVQQAYDNLLQEYTRQAKIDGFRPGRAPSAMVARRYQRELLEHVRDDLVAESYRDALKQEKLTPLAVSEAQDAAVTLGQPLRFSVLLDVPPDFTLPAYRGIPLEGRPVEVADAEVETAMKALRDDRARFEEVTGRPAQMGDLVLVDYDGVCEGRPVGELAPKAEGLGQGKDFWLLMENESFLPGFAAGLAGAAVGERRQVMVRFDDHFKELGIAGKQATYLVTVKALREKILPALDEAFFRQQGVATETEWREKIRAGLRAMKESGEKRRLRGEVMKHLLAQTQLEVPESVVQEETQRMVYDIVRDNTYRGATKEQIADKKGEIFEMATRSAVEKVKLRFILRRIAEQENVAAAKEDVDREIAEMAREYRIAPNEVRERLKKNHALDDLEENVRARKTMDLLVDAAQVRQAS